MAFWRLSDRVEIEIKDPYWDEGREGRVLLIIRVDDEVAISHYLGTYARTALEAAFSNSTKRCEGINGEDSDS